jgi:hypothetical protein
MQSNKMYKKDYNQVDQRLHLLCQVIGKANRTYVPEKPDESHTNLYFDPWGNKILGRWIQSGSGSVLFTLNLKTLQYEVLNASRKPVLKVPSLGKTMEDIESEFEALLPKAGLDPAGFRTPMPHPIPDYPFGNKPQRVIDAQALDQWKYFRKLANQTCYHFLGYAQAFSDVRIWPEHFDTGMYFEYAGNMGIGFGFAMEDSMVGEPYFYMAGYPKYGSLVFENLPLSPAWKWELGEHWKGVVLPVSGLEKAAYQQTEKILGKYFKHNFDWYVNQDTGAA